MYLLKENSCYANEMETILTDIIANYRINSSIHFTNRNPLPSNKNIIKILYKLLAIFFPGYFEDHTFNELTINYIMGNELISLFDLIVAELEKSLKYRGNFPGDEELLKTESIRIALDFFHALPTMRSILLKDVETAYRGDPAAQSVAEILLSYPGIFAITAHRIAHFFYKKQVPLIPRMIAEYSHSKTGIDIHPGATIGEYFFIDHGTGVVIGETSEIGNNVRLYQGVTLGALSFPRDTVGNIIKGLKRHPQIEDNVIIYAGATILGGETVIGKNSVIGGNVWITSSIPPYSKVSLDVSELKIQITQKSMEARG